MFKKTRNLKPSDYLTIAANLVPVFGVWAWDWSPNEVFLVYCLETIVIGIFTLIKMGIITIVRKTDTWYSGGGVSKQSGLFFMLFFLMHYGLFVGVQMGIFFGVSSIGRESHVTAFNFFYKWPELISNDTLIMLGAFGLSYGYRLMTDFLLPRQYRTISLMRVMFQPYGRIIIQQLTVIVGSMFLTFGAGKIFILVFAIVKIFFEVYFSYDDILEKGMTEMEKKSGRDKPIS